jgi:Zn-dependent peptidase ImmA (M78 family)
MNVGALLATMLREELKIKGKADLLLTAESIGLRIKEVKSTGFEGALVRDKKGNKGIIAVKAQVPELGRRRFTIAHEIGHFVIPTHRLLATVCKDFEIESWGKNLQDVEIEANQFAAEFLLPAFIVRNEIGSGVPSISRISLLAGEYETSLTVAVRRFVEFTDYACAMVWSQNGQARSYNRSERFTFFLPIKDIPRKQTYAGRLFSGMSAPNDFSPVDPQFWFDAADAQQIGLLLEQSVFLPNYNAVITLLWIQNPPEPKYEDELLEELDPKSFTLQRKRWPR